MSKALEVCAVVVILSVLAVIALGLVVLFGVIFVSVFGLL